MAAPVVAAPTRPAPVSLRRLASDTGWMAMVTALPLVVRLAVTPVRVRLLSPADFGDVALWGAAVAVVGGFALWPAVGLMRHLPAGDARDRAQVIRGWLVATVVTAAVATAALAGWAVHAGQAWGWVAAIVALEALITAATSYARAVGRFRALAAVSLTASLAGTAVGTLLIAPLGPVGVLVGWVAADVLALALAAALVGPSVVAGLRAGRGRQLGRLVRFAAPLAVSNGTWMLVTWIDRPLLAGFVSKGDLGLYSLAYVLVAAPLAGLFTILSSVTWNHAVEAFEGDGYPAAADLLGRSARIYTAAAVPAVVCLAVYGDAVLGVLAPESYQGASRHIVWLALGLWWFGLLPYRNQHLMLWNRSSAAAFSPLVALAVNVVALLALVPHVGAVGAAVATAAAYGGALLVATWMCHRDERVVSRLPLRLSAACLAASAAGALALRPVFDAVPGRWAQAVALAGIGALLVAVSFLLEGTAVKSLRRRTRHAPEVVACAT